MAPLNYRTRADKLFADQFETTDDGAFLYRRSLKGAPIKVSLLERNEFVEQFIKMRQRAGWVLMFGLFALAISAVFIFNDADSRDAHTYMFVGAGAIVTAFLVFWRWAWSAPARLLADRQPEGPALEKIAARRAGLKRMAWEQFAFAGLAVLIGGVWLSTKVDLLAGWNRLWLVGGAAYVALLFLRIWQKWQADHIPD